jgi:hypothetical protein
MRESAARLPKRSSFAGALIMGGAAVTEVQALCGRASPAIILKVYSRWFKNGRQQRGRSAEQLDPPERVQSGRADTRGSGENRVNA